MYIIRRTNLYIWHMQCSQYLLIIQVFSLEIQTIIPGVFIMHIAIKTYINMV